jgi:hypothetical protein
LPKQDGQPYVLVLACVLIRYLKQTRLFRNPRVLRQRPTALPQRPFLTFRSSWTPLYAHPTPTRPSISSSSSRMSRGRMFCTEVLRVGGVSSIQSKLTRI